MTWADRPIPTCLAHHSSHSSSKFGFESTSSNRLYYESHPYSRDSYGSRASCPQDGYRDFEAHLASPEDETAAPAFPPGRGQRSQGSTTLIFSTHHFPAPSWGHVCRLQSQSHQWCAQCGEWRQGSPEPNQEYVAETRRSSHTSHTGRDEDKLTRK